MTNSFTTGRDPATALPGFSAAGHHGMPEIVIHRDTDDDWKRISLIDDYGDTITLSTGQLRSLAAIVLSGEFDLITGLKQ